MKIRGEVRAAFHTSIRVDVNGAHARPTGLPHLAAHVPRNLLEVVIGVRDDAARAALERQQLGNQRIEAGVVIRAKEKSSIPVLGVRVYAEIDAEAQRRGMLHDRMDLIEVVVPNHRVEPHVVDAQLT